ncbi:MAG: serine/threonine-protein phosphatase [Myxococcota bacterium]|nr:serine/threonine-protein phosphatase [Myxococcota bacterium]
MRAGGDSRKGPRKTQNQDAFCRLEEHEPVRGQLFAVADGVGTVKLGQWAARLTCLRIEQFFYSDQTITTSALTQLVSEIDWELRGEGKGRAACTLSILWLHGEEAVVVHVGDSAIYQVRRGDISRITQIHGGGRGLQAFMGMGSAVSEVVQIQKSELREGDVFFLVTDGVSDVLAPSELSRLWVRSGGDPDLCAHNILESVSFQNGSDDATAVVVQFLSDGSQERVESPLDAPHVPGRFIG